MGIIESIKKAASWFDNRHAERTELEYLRTVYMQKNDNIRTRQWYRVCNENGDIVGFSFCCACGTEYQLLNINLWMGRTHECPQCHTVFDVLKDAGINPEKTNVSKWAEKFAALPMRPRLATARKSPYVDTWANQSEETVQWAGDKSAETFAGLNGLEYSDPLAFSKHGH
ncbi:MAG: hypothetical protein WA182_12020 [Candidatus Sulfotelmatobacter sp.]